MYSVNDRFLILEAFTEGKPLLDALSTETKHAANFLSGMTLEKSLEIDDAGTFGEMVSAQHCYSVQNMLLKNRLAI